MTRRRSRRLAAVLVLTALVSALAGCDSLRVFFPKKEYETTPPELPAELSAPAILLFTKTNGFRHEEGIPAGVAAIEEIAGQRGWSVFHTENGAVFNTDDLSRFAVAVWHQTSGDTLDETQKQAFKAWLEAGGGFVGVHGAGGDTSYDWRWYVEDLIGAQFIGHIMGPQFQDAEVVVEDREHPATAGLPERFSHNEEWYSFDASPRSKPGFRVLASVDESTYDPTVDFLWMNDDIAMGDHPVVWSHCVGKGRAFFTALGHQAGAYTKQENRDMLEGAIAWAAGVEGDDCGTAAGEPLASRQSW
jgi:type 1 glutamine amidotransferase